MTEQTEGTPPNLAPQPTELDLLKQRAKVMGINHSNNIKPETLRNMIEEKLAGGTGNEPGVTGSIASPNQNERPVLEPNPFDLLAQEKSEKPRRPLSLRQYMLQEQTKLLRCRITNLDPKKKDLPGEIITVANEYLGTIRKFIPYGEVTDNGYHIPFCIYNFLKRRKFVSITTKKDPVTKREHTTHRDVPEFSIEIMTPLTPEEIDDLRQAQLAAGSVD